MITDAIYQELRSTSKLGNSGVKFSIWKTKINLVLSELDVSYTLTDPKPTEPNEDSPTEEKEQYKKWLKDDFTCRTVMLFAMEDDCFLYFEVHKGAKDMMDAITKHFLSTSMLRRMFLFKKYQNYKMPEGTDINDHIVKMGVMARELEEAGMDCPEEFHAVFLLNSLPNSWRSAIDTRMIADTKNNDLSMDCVIGYVKAEAEIRALSSLKEEKDEEELDEKDRKKGGFKGKRFSH